MSIRSIITTFRLTHVREALVGIIVSKSSYGLEVDRVLPSRGRREAAATHARMITNASFVDVGVL